MRAEATAFRADVDGEIAEGRLTGFAGRGAVSGTLEQIADRLDGMVAEADGGSALLRERQAEALSLAVRPRVEQTFASLAALARDTPGEAVELPRFEHLSAPEAAMRYMDQFPIYRGMAIAIDAMPLFFLLLLAATTLRGEPGFGLTVGELHQAVAVYANLRQLVEGADNVTLLPRSRRARP